MKAVVTDKLPNDRTAVLAGLMADVFKANHKDGERGIIIICKGEKVGVMTLQHEADSEEAITDLLYALEMVLISQGKGLEVTRKGEGE